MSERKDLRFHLSQAKTCVQSVISKAEVQTGKTRNWGDVTEEKRQQSIQRSNEVLSRHVKIIKEMLQEYREESENASD
jgi:hypothetical protein